MANNYEVGAFSFADVSVAILGPGIATTLSGIAEEGITIAYEGDAIAVVMGADGSGMVSQRVAQNGTVTIRLLKTGLYNNILAGAFYFQRGSTVNTAGMRIIVRDPVRGDLITCQGCSFRKMPDLTFAMAPGTNEWAFTALRITSNLGPGVISTIAG